MEDSLIDLSGPTPKKLRMYPPKCTSGNMVKITLNDNGLEEGYHDGLSDWDEVEAPEAIAACNSPPKNGAQATSLVSNL